MTAHPHLKQHIRDRMARTGESYTTTRRHVLAAGDRTPPPRPEGLLPSWPATGGGDHHGSALAAHLIAASGTRAPHTGEPYSEAMVAGLAGGIGFMYFVFSYDGHHPTMTIVARRHPEPYVAAALRAAGVEFTEQHTGSAAVAERRLRAGLAAGRPMAATVDRTRLPWHGLDGSPYGPEPHPVGICGSRPGDVVLLDDECVQPNPLGLSELMAAWSAPAKNRHELLEITGPAPADHDVPAALRDAVVRGCALLTEPVLGNNFDVNFGFRGMRKLADGLADPRGKRGWARLFAHPEAMFTALRRLHDCLETEYTASGATWPLWAAFLEEAAVMVGEPAWTAAAVDVRASGVLWSGIAERALSIHPALTAYGELATERQRLIVAHGAEAAAEIRCLTGRVDGLAAAYAADPPDLGAVRELLDELAAAVRAAQEREERAVAALTD